MPNINVSIWSVAIILSAVHGIVLTALLFKSRKNYNSSIYFLAISLIIIIVELLFYFVGLEGLYNKAPFLKFVSVPFWLMLGPFLYFYFLTSLRNEKLKNKTIIINLLPALISFIVYLPYYIQPNSYKLNPSNNYPPIVRTIITVIYMIQIIVYVYLSYKELKKFVSNAKDKSSNTIIEKSELLKKILLFFIIYTIIDLSVSVTMMLRSEYYFVYVFISYLTLSIYIYIIAYNYIKHPQNILGGLQNENTSIKSTNIKDIDVDEAIKNLYKTMLELKPYLNNELKLPDLAELLGLTMHQLSEILNQKLNTNFYDFINKYRIMKAKEDLLDANLKEKTILTIALENGFNSSASFYRIFKKETGTTPSNFIKLYKLKNAS